VISAGSQHANDPLRYLDAGAVESVYRGLSPQCDRVVVEMGRLLQRAAESCVPAVQVKGRVKRLPSLMDKLQRKFTSEELAEPLPALRQLADLMALRDGSPVRRPERSCHSAR